jgi:hypothetical protein
LTPSKITKQTPSEIFLLQHPSEISIWPPSQKFRISDPFGKSLVNRGMWILNEMAQKTSIKMELSL